MAPAARVRLHADARAEAIRPRLTRAAAGIDEELARRLWRAVGFPDVPPGVEAFTDRDVDAARLAFMQAPESDIEQGTLLQQVRVISGSLARVASVEATGFSELLEELHGRYSSDDDVALAIFSDTRLAAVGVLIDYLHRLQLRAAVWRRMVLAADPTSRSLSASPTSPATRS